jgi:hypothetical protein
MSKHPSAELKHRHNTGSGRHGGRLDHVIIDE